MDFALLKARLSLPDGAEDYWHRHMNRLPDGSEQIGGWVQDSAFVASTVFVSDNAIVAACAVLTGHVRIEDYAVVTGSATIADHVCIAGARKWQSNVA